MSHISQVQLAIDFIEDNLKQELLTEEIARRAGFSSWHFQRFFRAMVGDGVKEYVRKWRLTQAAEELSETNNRIIELPLTTSSSLKNRFPELSRRCST